MTPYLIGGTGFLLGAILALWWRYKLAKAEGTAKVLTEKLITANDTSARSQAELADAVKANTENRAAHTAELVRRDEELKVHIEREEKLRDLLRTSSDPHVIAARVGLLFPKKP